MFLILMLLYREMLLYNTFAVLKEALEYTSSIFPSVWIPEFQVVVFYCNCGAFSAVLGMQVDVSHVLLEK